jgi:hypothetical protein
MLPVGRHEATRRAVRRRGHCQGGLACCNCRLGLGSQGGREGRGCPGLPPALATRVRAGDPRRRRRPFTPHFTSSNSSEVARAAHSSLTSRRHADLFGYSCRFQLTVACWMRSKLAAGRGSCLSPLTSALNSVNQQATCGGSPVLSPANPTDTRAMH